jgi:hypothetical protein
VDCRSTAIDRCSDQLIEGDQVSTADARVPDPAQFPRISGRLELAREVHECPDALVARPRQPFLVGSRADPPAHLRDRDLAVVNAQQLFDKARVDPGRGGDHHRSMARRPLRLRAKQQTVTWQEMPSARYLPAEVATNFATASICAGVSVPLNAGMTLPPFSTWRFTLASDGFSWSRFGPIVPVACAAFSV